MTKPIKTQNNSYATTDDTPNHVSKSRAGFILSFSPPVMKLHRYTRNKRHVWRASKGSLKMNSPIKDSFNG